MRTEGWDSLPGTLTPGIPALRSLMNRLASRILRSQGGSPVRAPGSSPTPRSALKVTPLYQRFADRLHECVPAVRERVPPIGLLGEAARRVRFTHLHRLATD